MLLERLHNVGEILKLVKAKKRELAEENYNTKKNEYKEVLRKAEIRTDVDFFRTLKQKCKELDIRWYEYKEDISKKHETDNQDKLDKLNNYLSENASFTQQCKIICEYTLNVIIILFPLIIFLICFFIKVK